jgi:hypothetical protein
LIEHDLFGKPVSTFPDHALGRRGIHGTKPKYTFFLGTNEHLALDECRMNTGSAMPNDRTKFQRENVMAEVYLGIAIAGVNALVVMGAAFAFALI